MIGQIPFELRALDQWVIAGPDKHPVNPGTKELASVIDPRTWGSFEQASACGYPHIGFVLSKSDPYTIIDLDDPHFKEKDQLDPDPESVKRKQERHSKILDAFDTYTELSQSRTGVHIICRGRIAHGVRRDRVEVYSDSRYMICTGEILKPRPIIDCQDLLDFLYKEMDSTQMVMTELVQIDGSLSDDQIFNMASSAANAEKFTKLFNGAWQDDYPSQSEADFALLSMFTFYSKDNEQVRRMFRYSALGKRPKATKNNTYIDYALSKIRAKELPLIDFTSLITNNNEGLQIPPHQQEAAPGQETAGSNGTFPGENRPHIEQQEREPESANAGVKRNQSGDEEIEYPPGFIGQVAEYIHAAAIRPVREIALAAAIALTAGVVGRAFNISGTGLNQYLILLAPTGSGKEGAAKGIDALITAVRTQIPMADDFIGPSAFASGQALIRVLDKKPCFVSVLGEFGLTLTQLCSPHANAAQVMLKKVLLDIYAKSGFTSVLRSSVYSEEDKNTKVVQAPNVTIFGESTPDTFYDSLDSTAIAAGLIPRFSVFEYTGPRPHRNPTAFQMPGKQLVDEFAYLMHTAISAQQNRAHCPVVIDHSSKVILDAFDLYATNEINSNVNDITNQLWNRAHLKALKLAALVAVGINPNQPVVEQECAKWACRIVERDIGKLLAKFKAGDIGQGDARLEADLRRAIHDYFALGKRAKRESYHVPAKMLDAPVIPLVYLKRRLRLLASFRNDRRGANAALGAIIKAMQESGELQQINPIQAASDFGVASPIFTWGPNW